MRMDRSYAAVTREVTARRNEGRNSVNVPVTSRGTMLAMSFCVCDVRRYGFTVGSVSQTMLFIFLSEFRFPRAWCTANCYTVHLHDTAPGRRGVIRGVYSTKTLRPYRLRFGKKPYVRVFFHTLLTSSLALRNSGASVRSSGEKRRADKQKRPHSATAS